MKLTEKIDYEKIRRHDHTSPDAQGCPLCEAFEGLERHGAGDPVQKRIEGMKRAAHGTELSD